MKQCHSFPSAWLPDQSPKCSNQSPPQKVSLYSCRFGLFQAARLGQSET